MSDFEFQDTSLKKTLKSFYEKNRGMLGLNKSELTKFVSLLSIYVYRDIQDHFANQEGEGGKWAPWSSSYRESMDARGYGGNKILQFTGRMRNEFKPTNTKTKEDGIAWFNNAKTDKGFPYAEAHNEGGPVLPKRDFMWLSGWAMDSIEKGAIAFFLDEDP